MKAIYSDRYGVDLGAHVFITGKYKLVKEKLERLGFEVIEPRLPSWEDLLLVHTKEYLNDLQLARRTPRTMTSELPVREEVIAVSRLGAGGTYLTSQIALEEKVAFHIGGGLHHAFPGHAEGFCYINDVAYALKKLKSERKIISGVIVDCDLHQGNGNAFIFQDDTDIFTFSIHEEDIYPIKQKSDLDIGLESFVEDDQYLQLLAEAMQSIVKTNFDLAIYIASSDPYEDDKLGDLKLSIPGLQARDHLVLEILKDKGIPVAIVMGGGYAGKIEDTVKIHTNTASVAKNIFS